VCIQYVPNTLSRALSFSGGPGVKEMGEVWGGGGGIDIEAGRERRRGPS
jgi:hypothetical protein